MRFLMLNWRDPRNPLAGGAERVTLGYLAELARRGHEVYWFAYSFAGAAPQDKIEGGAHHSKRREKAELSWRRHGGTDVNSLSI